MSGEAAANNNNNSKHNGSESVQTKYAGLINEGYSIIKEIGHGSYSTVLRVKHQSSGGATGHDLAAKAINTNQLKPRYLSKFIPRELEIMAKINHPNIIRIDTILKLPGYIYLIGELATSGDLLSYIRNKKKMDEAEARRVFADCLNGIEYLHANGIAHRDIKCENVLFTSDMTAKLCDLGFARYQTSDDFSSTFCGSAAYAPPEILESKPYKGQAADIWSLGVLLYIMVTGLMPYDERKPEKMLDRQKRHQVPYHRSIIVSPEVKELIKNMLHPQWSHRASIQMVKVSPWMSPYPSNSAYSLQSSPHAAPSETTLKTSTS